MKLNRRQGMLAAIGGLVAGSTKGPPTSPFSSSPAMQISEKMMEQPAELNPIEAALKKDAYRKELAAIVRGEFLPWQKRDLEEIETRWQNEANINCLKSISESFRAELSKRLYKKRKINYFMDEAKKDLLRVFGIKI